MFRTLSTRWLIPAVIAGRVAPDPGALEGCVAEVCVTGMLQDG